MKEVEQLTNVEQVPIAANRRRFGNVPEDVPPPSSSAHRPPAEEMKFFNGIRERERDGRDDRNDRPRDDYDRRRDDYRGDDRGRERGGDRYGDREREPRRFDDRGPEDRDRGRDAAPVEGECHFRYNDVNTDIVVRVDGPRKRRSRWGDAAEKVEVAGLPTAVMGNVSQHELDNYAGHGRLEESNRKLRTGDVVPPDNQR